MRYLQLQIFESKDPLGYSIYLMLDMYEIFGASDICECGPQNEVLEPSPVALCVGGNHFYISRFFYYCRYLDISGSESNRQCQPDQWL